MSSKKNKIKIVLIGSILIFLIVILMFIPGIEIELIGKSKLTLEVGSSYEELGANATISSLFGKEKIAIETDGDVDTTKIGEYVITYTAKKKIFSKTIKRVIKIVDTQDPIITINSPITACQNNKVVDLDVTATDNYDKDISDKIKYRIENDTIYLIVEDSTGNKTELKSALKYIDDEEPIINLNNTEIVYLKQGDTYEEYGAIAKDSCDGDISQNIKITGNVDTSKQGEYEIKYEVKDSIGNSVVKIRKVVVLSKEDDPKNYVTAGTIYLTFDDGPGIYTKDFLAVLDKYNVKATFFVTGQFSKYYNLIKEEYDKGHTIGIHTFSHKWEIYDSIDAYWQDFTKIENIIYEQTGIHPKYFRFPGGSSNTVSRKHCDKIMTNLDQLMTEKGYIYFDWTFDSCDTCKNNSKEDIIKTVKTYLKGNGDYIILMHDIKKNTLLALPEIIEYAKSKGYVFKAIDENTPVKHFKIAN